MESGREMLLEREAESRQLGSALTAAVGGRGRLVVVKGEAGIGKSAMLAEALSEGERCSFRVLTARGAELERDFPYGVVRQLLEGELARASRARRGRLLAGAAGLAAPIVAPLEGGSAAPDAFATQHGLYWLAANLAAECPLALLVDDVQWADRPSLAWLGYVARRLEGVALLVVVARRTGEPAEDELLRGLEAASSERLCPAPLGEASVATLVRAELGTEPDSEFIRVCREFTGGNPFFVTELASELAAAGIAPTSDGIERLRLLAPAGIQQSVLLRLARLPGDAAKLTSAVCVLGESGLRHAAALAGLEEDRAAAAADALANAAILAPGLPLRFRHPLLRATVEHDIGAVRLAAWHGRAARVLAEGGATPERVAAQLLESEPAGEEWVVASLREAAAAAVARGAPDIAAGYLRRAVAEPLTTVSRVEVLGDLGRAEALAFSPEAIQHFRAALELAPDPGSRARLGRELALVLWQAGQTREAGQVLGPLVDPGAVSVEGRLWLEAERAAIAIFSLDAGWEELDPALERVASGLAGATAPERALLVAHAARLAQRGAPSERVLDILGPVLERGVLDELPPGSNLHAAAGFALLAAGAYETVVERFGRDLARARQAGSRFGAGQALNMLAMARFRQGDLREAHIAADEAVAIARDVGIATGLAATLGGGLLPVLADRGLASTGLEELARDGLADEAPDFFASAMLLEGRGRAHLVAGDAARALDDLRAGGELYRRWAVGGPGFSCWRSHTAEALVALRRSAEAAELATEDVELAARAGVRSALGIALRALALTQHGEQQLQTLERAIDVLSASQARLEYARALCEYGAALRRQNHRREARSPLRQALELTERSGASPLAERCRTELQASGARPRSIARVGVDALTPAELRVCELAATGRSNPEIAQALFVTRATVESQLHSAYRKLDISGRAQLAEAVARGREPNPVDMAGA